MSGADGLKVLIVAPNASPLFGGEAFLPLKYFELLAERGHRVRLLTHERSRPSLLGAFPHLADRMTFIKDSPVHKAIWRGSAVLPHRARDILTGAALTTLTEQAQAVIIRDLVATGEVDVIHQPIPVSPKQPSAVYRFGVPVVIGPMNGGMTYPEGYSDFESAVASRTVALGRIAAKALNRVLPGKQRAHTLLVANARTRAALPVRHPRVVELVENAVDLRTWTSGRHRPARAVCEPFRLLFVGRLVGWKCLDITLQALAQARAAGVDVTLDVVGDGPEMASLRSQAQPLGDAVRFHGFQPQTVCAEMMSASDALILNSIWECGGAVVLEAMALGLPVIASDWGGPADYLDPSCGILVPPEPRAEFVGRIAAGIVRLAEDPDLCRSMGAAGAAKVRREFDWRSKIDVMEQIYQTAINESAVRERHADFGSRWPAPSS